MTRCAQTQPAFSSTNQVQDVGSDLSIAILVPTGESNAGTGRAPTGVGRSGDIVLCRDVSPRLTSAQPRCASHAYQCLARVNLFVTSTLHDALLL
jgi:hypothetical protein